MTRYYVSNSKGSFEKGDLTGGVRPRRECKEEGGMLHPSWAATVCLPRHGWRTPPLQSWRVIATTISWKKRWPAGPRDVLFPAIGDNRFR